MDRLDLDKAYAPPEPITWPGGGEQNVRWLTWRQEEVLADADGDEAKMRAVMPKVMEAILPGRSWDEIADTLDAQTMQDVVKYASRAYHKAQAELDNALGNSVAGAAPASPPPAPSAPSSPALHESTAAPCGAL